MGIFSSYGSGDTSNIAYLFHHRLGEIRKNSTFKYNSFITDDMFFWSLLLSGKLFGSRHNDN
jgi:hypothetical protein